MAIIKDPENHETATLHAMIDFTDQRVLEVGCGEGRLTWRYADHAAQVTAIDPDRQAIEIARAATPERLAGHVQFLESSLTDFAAAHRRDKFDLAIFAWSL